MLFSDPHLPGNPIVYANQSFLSLTGYERSEVLGQSYHFLIGPETDPDARPQIAASFGAGLFDGLPEIRYYRKNGSSFWAVVFVGPVLAVDGTITQHFVSFLDVTARRHEERRLRLLLNELNHRTQNTLTTVQAIALQTLHGIADRTRSTPSRGASWRFRRRTGCSARPNWQAASLRAVLDVDPGAFRPERRPASRFSIEGDDLRLQPKLALTFALVFQELATNAAKYGALSTGETGRCGSPGMPRRTARPRSPPRWQESGGPKVGPRRTGASGRYLIEGGLAKELKGEVRLHYEPARLRLPHRHALPEHTQETRHEPPRPELRILLVEDEMIVAGMLQGMLATLGYEVAGHRLARRGGAEDHRARAHRRGGARHQSQRRDELPDRRRAGRRGIPFVFSTGYEPQSLPEAYADLMLLKKPFRRLALADALRDILPPGTSERRSPGAAAAEEDAATEDFREASTG